MRGLPGVEAVAIVNQLPMTDVSANASFDVEGRPSNTDINLADTQIISPDYFRAMGISLMQGRFLNDEEAQLPPASIIVNQTLARKACGGQIPSASEVRLVQTTHGFLLLASSPYQEPRLECRHQTRDVFLAFRPAVPNLSNTQRNQ